MEWREGEIKGEGEMGKKAKEKGVKGKETKRGQEEKVGVKEGRQEEAENI